MIKLGVNKNEFDWKSAVLFVFCFKTTQPSKESKFAYSKANQTTNYARENNLVFDLSTCHKSNFKIGYKIKFDDSSNGYTFITTLGNTILNFNPDKLSTSKSISKLIQSFPRYVYGLLKAPLLLTYPVVFGI